MQTTALQLRLRKKLIHLHFHFQEAITVLGTSLKYYTLRLRGRSRIEPYAVYLYNSFKRVQLYNELVCNERTTLFQEILHRYVDNRYEHTNFHVLDIGCGSGLFESLALHRYKNLNITALDIADPMLSYTRQSIGCIGDITSLRLVKNDFQSFLTTNHSKYDLVLCIAMLRFIDDPEIFFMNLRKQVKENGIVVFRTLRTTHFGILRVFVWSLLTFRLRPTILELDKCLLKILKTYGFSSFIVNSSADLPRKISIIEARLC